MLNLHLRKVQILNTTIHNLAMEETVKLISDAVSSGIQIQHTVVNAGKIVKMYENEELKQSVVSADLINADGQAVVWASKFLGKPLKERVAGIDLMQNLVNLAFEKEYKIYFFGATEEVLKKVIHVYSERYSPNIIAGYRHGYFEKEEEVKIAQQIANSGANILFVAITSPIKENFLYKHRKVLKKVNFTMGVGGSFDVVAGKVTRAPKWMQNLGLEWLHRVFQEPRRMFKRYLLGNTKFILLVLKEKLRGVR